MAKTDEATPGDPLKYYCIVFGVLILVIGVVWYGLRNSLETYRLENERAERLLTIDANEMDHLNRPRQLASLGLATQRLVAGYSAAVGTGGDTKGIASDRIDAQAKDVFLTVDRWDPEITDPYRNKGFEQVHRACNLLPTDLENFTKFLYNVESLSRYRVFEVNWRMRPPRENSEEPFFLIMGPQIKIGFRRPLATGS